MEGKRQQQVNKLIQQNLSLIFQREGLSLFGNVLVTVTEARVSPDLSFAKVYVSIFKADSPEEIVNDINKKQRQIRGLLGSQIKNQVRIIPELHFVLDETLDEVFRIEKIFEDLKKDKKDDKD